MKDHLIQKKYNTLTPLERMEAIFQEYDANKILFTSSFGSTSVILLHMLSKTRPKHPVYFIDTAYLFHKTHEYKKLLQERLNLNIIDIKAPENEHRFTRENKSWKYNQDLCCFINKVHPVNQLKQKHDIWISGLLAYQNANRQKLGIFESKEDITKFHPILDMTAEEVTLYMSINELPAHPLVNEGYDSLGCIHCTKKGKGREGRWSDIVKTECGLHT